MAELARRFVLSVDTVREWIAEVDVGVERRVKTREPVDRLPDAVREIAVLLRWEQLAWGARRIADVMRGMKLTISRTTVQRILRRHPRRPAVVARKPKRCHRTLVAKHRHHVWLMDLTTISSCFGLIRRRIAAVMDAYTRAIVATGVCPSEPTADWVCGLLSRAIRDATTGPTHLITDRGSQFTSGAFRRLLRRRRIRHRYGAVSRHGSIALIERFWRTLKSECLDATSTWLGTGALTAKVARYVDWFNRIRPHQGLEGRAPTSAGAAPPRPLKIAGCSRLTICRRDLHGDRRLPVYSLRLRRGA